MIVNIIKALLIPIFILLDGCSNGFRDKAQKSFVNNDLRSADIYSSQTGDTEEPGQDIAGKAAASQTSSNQDNTNQNTASQNTANQNTASQNTASQNTANQIINGQILVNQLAATNGSNGQKANDSNGQKPDGHIDALYESKNGLAKVQRNNVFVFDEKGGKSIPKLDRELLNALDGTKTGWGIRYNPYHLTPQIPKSLMDIFSSNDTYYCGSTNEKKVYLVFSAGYEAGYTPLILDTLAKHDIKALFLLVGDYVRDKPELVKRMIDEGHEVGNHSLSHKCFPDISVELLEQEIAGFEQMVYDSFGYSCKYFMPPSGEYSERVLGAAKLFGYKTILWSFTYPDYDAKYSRGPEYTHDLVMENLHNGAFIFLHSTFNDNAQALDRLIGSIKSEGYVISPMDV